jgi:hypothetical protein
MEDPDGFRGTMKVSFLDLIELILHSELIIQVASHLVFYFSLYYFFFEFEEKCIRSSKCHGSYFEFLENCPHFF